MVKVAHKISLKMPECYGPAFYGAGIIRYLEMQSFFAAHLQRGVAVDIERIFRIKQSRLLYKTGDVDL